MPIIKLIESRKFFGFESPVASSSPDTLATIEGFQERNARMNAKGFAQPKYTNRFTPESRFQVYAPEAANGFTTVCLLDSMGKVLEYLTIKTEYLDIDEPVSEISPLEKDL